MIRKKLKAAGEWFEGGMRRMCGRINPDLRVYVIVVMFLLFAGMSLYFTAHSVYRFGKGEGQRFQIQHIKRLELQLREKQAEIDSIKHVNDFDYEYERETE